MRLLSLVLAAVFPVAALAGVTYTTESSFPNVTDGSYYVEDFSTYVYGGPYATSFASASGYAWTVESVGSGQLWANNSAISTFDAGDAILVHFTGSPTGSPVTWVGGVFGSTDKDGNIINQDFNVTLSTGDHFTGKGAQFVGFSTAAPIAWLRVDAPDTPFASWPQIDRLYTGTYIPEPASIALIPIAGCLLLHRRWRMQRIPSVQ